MLAGSVTNPITSETQNWLRDNIKDEQYDADIRFAELRARWVQQGAEWVFNQVRQREIGAAYETEFKIPKPQRTVFYDSGSGFMLEGQVPDPTLPDVVLPPPVPVAPPGIPIDGSAARDAELFRQLAALRADTKAIKKHFGIA